MKIKQLIMNHSFLKNNHREHKILQIERYLENPDDKLANEEGSNLTSKRKKYTIQA